MNKIEKLIEEIKLSVFGEPWHGSSVRSILSNVTENQSDMKIIAEAHTIKELTLHLLAWTEEVTSRLTGNDPSEPQIGDWPDPENYKDKNFEQIKNNLFEATKVLIQVLKNFPEEKLYEKVGTVQSAQLGTGASFETMIIGLLQHNAYHSGQIGILKKGF